MPNNNGLTKRERLFKKRQKIGRERTFREKKFEQIKRVNKIRGHQRFSAEYEAYIVSDAWHAKREEAFKILGKHCNRCGSTKRLTLHHKNYRRLGREKVKIDLEVLCFPCHEKEHGRKIG